jgi:hypothetical protein
VTACPQPLRIPLIAEANPVHAVQIRFLTPTELKFDNRLADQPEFSILFGRARDRVSTLRTLYGPGPLPIDFRQSGERAAQVRLVRSRLRTESIERRSSRTGQVHPIGGFVGEADYEGEIGEFLPILHAAAWTGVGRQTVWGKGQIEVVAAEL